MSVAVQELTKIFGTQKAVNQVSFSAKNGEIVGFLGPNGAGKSTTMKVVTCLLPPSEGKVTVCGYDVEEDPIKVRQKIGYLPEHNPLYLDMYVHEYLRFAGSFHIKNNHTLKSRVRAMIDICGLTVEQNKLIGALSKGYRQRVGLAQALLHDPDVLILDEPTTGLDPNQIIEIRDLIRNLGKDKTVIFSTHIMQEVQALCDRVIIINKGEIVANDIPANLKNLSQEVVHITIEFKEHTEQKLLMNIDGVLHVDDLGSNSFKLTASKEKDIRPLIFKFATFQNLTLVKLNQEESSMEDIFRQLTQKNS